jgi:hypothetical protein
MFFLKKISIFKKKAKKDLKKRFLQIYIGKGKIMEVREKCGFSHDFAELKKMITHVTT